MQVNSLYMKTHLAAEPDVNWSMSVTTQLAPFADEYSAVQLKASEKDGQWILRADCDMIHD